MHILPTHTATPEKNMALDLLMLEAYPCPEVPRFRFYGWSLPSWTFGYTQKWSTQHDIIQSMAVKVVRRSTGGGLVDHFHDWTYALVIPATHPLFGEQAEACYKAVHSVLAGVLNTVGCPAKLKLAGEAPVADDQAVNTTTLSVCFERAERYDVIGEGGAKLAGAAQKRTRDGLLMEGSINRQAVGSIDETAFAELFPQELAKALGSEPQPVDFPEFDAKRMDALVERMGSDTWNRGKG